MQKFLFLHPEFANLILNYCRNAKGNPEHIEKAMNSFSEAIEFFKAEDISGPVNFNKPNTLVFNFLCHAFMSLVIKESPKDS